MEYYLYLSSVSVHILCVIVWLGGAAFLAITALPFFRKKAPELLFYFLEFSEKKLRRLSWALFFLIILTGSYSACYRFGPDAFATKEFWTESAGQTFLCKLLIFIIIIALSFWHDFFSGPQTLSVWRKVNSGNKNEEMELSRLRKQASMVGRIIAVLGIGMIFLAVKLVRG